MSDNRLGAPTHCGFDPSDASHCLSGVRAKVAPVQSQASALFSDLQQFDPRLAQVVTVGSVLCGGLLLGAVTVIASLVLLGLLFGLSGLLFVIGLLCTPVLVGTCFIGVPILVVTCLLGLGVVAALCLVWLGQYLWLKRVNATSLTKQETTKQE